MNGGQHDELRDDAGAAQPPPPASPPPWRPQHAGPVPAEQPRRNRRRAGLIVAGVIVVLAAVTGVSTALVLNHQADVAAQQAREAADRKDAAEARAAEEAAQQREEAAAAELAARQSLFDTCEAELGPFSDALGEVDARLNVGLSQADLSDLVGQASVAYSRIDIDALGDGHCLSAGAALEDAFNTYTKTVGEWNDCIFDTYCTFDSIESDMQTKWSTASDSLADASNEFDQLDPSNPAFDSAGDPA